MDLATSSDSFERDEGMRAIVSFDIIHFRFRKVPKDFWLISSIGHPVFILLECLGLNGRGHMGVNIHRCRDIGVAKSFLDDLWVHSCLEEQRGVCVAQALDGDVR